MEKFAFTRTLYVRLICSLKNSLLEIKDQISSSASSKMSRSGKSPTYMSLALTNVPHLSVASK